MAARDRPNRNRRLLCTICRDAGRPVRVYQGHDTDHCRDAPRPAPAAAPGPNPAPQAPAAPQPNAPVPRVQGPLLEFIRPQDVAPDAPEPGEIVHPYLSTIQRNQFRPHTVYTQEEFKYCRRVGIPCTYQAPEADVVPDVNLHNFAALARLHGIRNGLAALLACNVREIVDLFGNRRTQRVLDRLQEGVPEEARANVSIMGGLYDPNDASRRSIANPEPDRADALMCTNVYQVPSLAERGKGTVALTPRELLAYMRAYRCEHACLVRHRFVGDAGTFSYQSAWIRTSAGIVHRPDLETAPYEHPDTDQWDVAGTYTGDQGSIYWSVSSKADINVVIVHIGALNVAYAPPSVVPGRMQVLEVDLAPSESTFVAAARWFGSNLEPIVRRLPLSDKVAAYLDRGAGTRRALVDTRTAKHLVTTYSARSQSSYTFATIMSTAQHMIQGDEWVQPLLAAFPDQTANLVRDTALYAFIAVANDESIDAFNRRHGGAVAKRNESIAGVGHAFPVRTSYALLLSFCMLACALIAWSVSSAFGGVASRFRAYLAQRLLGTTVGRMLDPHPTPYPVRVARDLAESRSMQVLFPRATMAVDTFGRLYEHAPRRFKQFMAGFFGRHDFLAALAYLFVPVGAHMTANAFAAGARAALRALIEEAVRLGLTAHSVGIGRGFSVLLAALEAVGQPVLVGLGNALAHGLFQYCTERLLRRPPPPEHPQVKFIYGDTPAGLWLNEFDRELPLTTPTYHVTEGLSITLDGQRNVMPKRSRPPLASVKPIPPRNPEVVVRVSGWPSDRPTHELVHVLGGLAVAHNVFGRTDANLKALVDYRLAKDMGVRSQVQQMVWTGITPLPWFRPFSIFGNVNAHALPGAEDEARSTAGPAFHMLDAFLSAWNSRDVLGQPYIWKHVAFVPLFDLARAPAFFPAGDQEPNMRPNAPGGILYAPDQILRTPELEAEYEAHLPLASRRRFEKGRASVGVGRCAPATRAEVITKTNDDLLKGDAVGRPIVVIDEATFFTLAPQMHAAMGRIKEVMGANAVIPAIAKTCFPLVHLQHRSPYRGPERVFRDDLIWLCPSGDATVETLVQLPLAVSEIARAMNALRFSVGDRARNPGAQLPADTSAVHVHLVLAAGDDTLHTQYDADAHSLCIDSGDLSNCDVTNGGGPLVAGTIVMAAAGLQPDDCALNDSISRVKMDLLGTDGYKIRIESPAHVRTGEPATGYKNAFSLLSAHAEVASLDPEARTDQFKELGFTYKSDLKTAPIRADSERMDSYKAFFGVVFLKHTWAPISCHGKSYLAFMPLESRCLKMNKCIHPGGPQPIYRRGLTYAEAAHAFQRDVAKSYSNCLLQPVCRALVRKWSNLDTALRRDSDYMVEEDPRQFWRIAQSCSALDVDTLEVVTLDPMAIEYGPAFAAMYDARYGPGSFDLALELVTAIEREPVDTLICSPLIERLLRDYA